MEDKNMPKHIAIIMDGNRRWAKSKNLETKDGHKAGADNLEKIASYANKIGLKYLTVYAFSTENWKRSKEEVTALMLLLNWYIDSWLKKADTENIRLKIIGDITVLSKALQEKIAKAIEKTKNNTGLTLSIAFNYGGRAELVMATKKIAEKVQKGEIKIEDITEETISENLYTAGEPDPDLLIRTSGELRTSNFLPWQITYSEFYFPRIHWPDFNEKELDKAIEIYGQRTRNFGGRK